MLLNKIAEFENLLTAFKNCSRGKRKSRGYQEMHFAVGESLLSIGETLRAGTYKWGKYRVFTISDPKPRKIMAAPFKDRLVHHGICQIIGPPIDQSLSDNVFACRVGKGSRQAALKLWSTLKNLGADRFVCKVDISKYFESIRHKTLMNQLDSVLKDDSVTPLIQSLLDSENSYRVRKQGIPIGNFTSQHFANFYLSQGDRVACRWLDIPYYSVANEESRPSEAYIRYMDDSVFVGREKKKVMTAVHKYLEFVREALGLEAGYHKMTPLGAAPVPFLGYVFSHDFYRPLQRNIRRYQKSEQRLKKSGARWSQINQVRVSHQAWRKMDINEFNG